MNDPQPAIPADEATPEQWRQYWSELVKWRNRNRGWRQPLSAAQFFRAILGDHVGHPQTQVGQCVYCDTCTARLYQGIVMTDREIQMVADLIEREENVDRGN